MQASSAHPLIGPYDPSMARKGPWRSDENDALKIQLDPLIRSRFINSFSERAHGLKGRIVLKTRTLNQIRGRVVNYFLPSSVKKKPNDAEYRCMLAIYEDIGPKWTRMGAILKEINAARYANRALGPTFYPDAISFRNPNRCKNFLLVKINKITGSPECRDLSRTEIVARLITEINHPKMFAFKQKALRGSIAIDMSACSSGLTKLSDFIPSQTLGRVRLTLSPHQTGESPVSVGAPTPTGDLGSSPPTILHAATATDDIDMTDYDIYEALKGPLGLKDEDQDEDIVMTDPGNNKALKASLNLEEKAPPMGRVNRRFSAFV